MKQTTKILIVEDEEAAAEALVKKISAAGFKALLARDGEEGLALAVKEKPDLILLDIIMPKMDGMTMLKKLRTNSWGEEAKVIILTNLSDAKSAFDALKNGTSDFLIKTNWSLDDVVTKIKKALKGK